MRVVITGGGTGGHIYPAISVGQALQELEPGIEMLFVGSSHGPEGEIARRAGFDYRAIPSSPLTKSASFRNVVSLMRLVAGVFRARSVLKAFGPNVVLGTGGYTTAAVLAAQRSLGGRTVIHEQNAVPGRTNRWLGRLADKICVSVESSRSAFQDGKVVFTGMPVREDFIERPTKSDARRTLGLREDAFTVLVVGGSQGAQRLNELVLDMWPLIDDGDTQVIHQVGQRNIESVRDKTPSSESYRAEAYLDMPVAAAAADMVICRSGASTIAEITVVGLPSILIPYPYAYADHQTKNAQELVDAGAGILLSESDADAGKLAAMVTRLREDQGKMEQMRDAAIGLAKPNAARDVAEVVITLARGS